MDSTKSKNPAEQENGEPGLNTLKNTISISRTASARLPTIPNRKPNGCGIALVASRHGETHGAPERTYCVRA